jgi:hypothetical protein
VTTDRKEMNVVNELDSIQRQEWESLAATTSFKTFLATREQYWKIASKDLPFDTRRNAVHWCLDVNRLIDEIVFSYTLMKGYVTLFKKTNPAGNFPSSSSFHVSYYADNCIARLDSCRDKLALAIWAYYCPFNPERRAEVLT